MRTCRQILLRGPPKSETIARFIFCCGRGGPDPPPHAFPPTEWRQLCQGCARYLALYIRVRDPTPRIPHPTSAFASASRVRVRALAGFVAAPIFCCGRGSARPTPSRSPSHRMAPALPRLRPTSGVPHPCPRSRAPRSASHIHRRALVPRARPSSPGLGRRSNRARQLRGRHGALRWRAWRLSSR